MLFRTQDPFTGQPKESYEYANEGKVLNSIESLNATFLKWQRLSPSERQKILLKLAAKLEAKKEGLAQLITSEMGKPLKESLAEVTKCILTIERACAADLSFLLPCKVKAPHAKSETRHEPLGVIYAIMPWNYPLWQAIRMAIPALLSGNTILLKHSDITPLVATALHELFEDVFESPILINNFINHDLTDFVLSNPRIGGVSLTGSVKAGRAVYKIAAEYFKKAVLELGGSDPYIVCADADLSLAVKKIAKGRLLNNGQSCIAVKRVIVHRSVLNSFLDLLKTEFDNFIFGSPSDPKTDLGPLAHLRFKKSLADQLINLKIFTEAKLVYSKPHNQHLNSAFVDAEIYLLETNSDWLKDQEFFGPILLVIPFATDEEALEVANSTNFGLGAGVFSRSIEHAEILAEFIKAGQVAINDVIITDLSLPFGGVKWSGIGRELGTESYLEFTQTKVITGL